MGWEGGNVIFDTWVHPLMMGLEEHLVQMFRDDFEFSDAAPSHLGPGRRLPAGVDAGASNGNLAARASAAGADSVAARSSADASVPAETAAAARCRWTGDAEAELKKIPFFVRGKARNNTERFARERGLESITIETLYDAKAHFAR
jgi:light-independent protochlorophyllide reductase subunit B